MRILCRAQRIGNDSTEKSGSGENITRLQGISTSVLKRLISEHLNIASHTTLNTGVNSKCKSHWNILRSPRSKCCGCYHMIQICKGLLSDSLQKQNIPFYFPTKSYLALYFCPQKQQITKKIISEKIWWLFKKWLLHSHEFP